jgi:hypothetical protein
LSPAFTENFLLWWKNSTRIIFFYSEDKIFSHMVDLVWQFSFTFKLILIRNVNKTYSLRLIWPLVFM